ncbi:MAG: PA0069 family radical SAM protein [Gammaproteobacteria bacterium]|nr:PA0069 family radical SAM protein [Gammaproteobacteria bacterium]
MGHKLDMPTKGRGALSSLEGRFETQSLAHDPEFNHEEATIQTGTEIFEDKARSIISTNASPDLGFERSINPYRGCEHGCIYCYARPSHAYLNLSPGLDFETKLFYKANAAELLQKELGEPGYVPKPIALGTNTDPYQPIERKLKITRSLLEVLSETNHPCTIVTKGTLIERDFDVLGLLASRKLVSVMVSVTTLDNDLKRGLEPRTPAGARRIECIRALREAGIDTGVLVAPVIPRVNDHEMEDILQAARDAGATRAGYVLIRLPHEVEPLFTEWLEAYVPQRAAHVLALIRDCHGGQVYDARFGKRMRGQGAVAELIGKRFAIARRRLGFETARSDLDVSRFCKPRTPGQLEMF